jgi:GTP cyclohydrolase FolE2
MIAPPTSSPLYCRTMNTLPRGDELAMVFRAHATPQFIEDALRESLWALGAALGGPSGFSRLTGRSRSLESIHDVDLAASAVLTSETARRLGAASAASAPRDCE